MLFRGELDALIRRQPPLRVRYFVRDNRLDANQLRSAIADPQTHRFYDSGPEKMVETFDAILKQHGVPESEVVNDFFPGYD